MTKVIITKEYNPIADTHYISVHTNEGLARCFLFYPNNTDTLYTEGMALKEAHELAKRLEKTNSLKTVSKVIYETPE